MPALADCGSPAARQKPAFWEGMIWKKHKAYKSLTPFDSSIVCFSCFYILYNQNGAPSRLLTRNLAAPDAQPEPGNLPHDDRIPLPRS